VNLSRLLDPCFTPGVAAFRRIDPAAGSSRGWGPIAVEHCAGRTVLRIDPSVLAQLAFEAFRDVNFLFRSAHLEQWAAILDEPGSSVNDRFVTAALLKNAAISAEGIFPSCQDTGTATVIGIKGEDVRTGGDDDAALCEGIARAYAECNLRHSQVAPSSMFEETNTRTNLPAQIDITAAPAGGPGAGEYRFLFIAKGGGSANKTFFFQETAALLNERAIGTAGCPPYHLAVVIDGTSAEANLKALKLATRCSRGSSHSIAIPPGSLTGRCPCSKRSRQGRCGSNSPGRSARSAERSRLIPLAHARLARQHAKGARNRKLQPDDRAAHGCLRALVYSLGGLSRDARKGQPLGRGHGGLQGVRRVLAENDRRSGRSHRPGLHRERAGRRQGQQSLRVGGRGLAPRFTVSPMLVKSILSGVYLSLSTIQGEARTSGVGFCSCGTSRPASHSRPVLFHRHSHPSGGLPPQGYTPPRVGVCGPFTRDIRAWYARSVQPAR